MKIKFTALLVSLAVGFVGATAHADKLVIKGSDTLGAKLVPQLAEQFKADHRHGEPPRQERRDRGG